MQRRRILPLSVLALAAILASVGSSADELKVYTNQDLRSLPATDLPPAKKPSTAVRPSPSPAAPAGVKDAAEEIPATESVEAARERVVDAAARVKELEKSLLAVHNPFLPRPQLSPEEAEAWVGLNGVDRAARVERQLAKARTDLTDAQMKLVRLTSP